MEVVLLESGRDRLECGLGTCLVVAVRQVRRLVDLVLLRAWSGRYVRDESGLVLVRAWSGWYVRDESGWSWYVPGRGGTYET